MRLMKYKLEVVFPENIEDAGTYEGFILADNPKDATYALEDKFSLLLDIESTAFYTSIYEDDELILLDGFAPDLHEEKENVK